MSDCLSLFPTNSNQWPGVTGIWIDSHRLSPLISLYFKGTKVREVTVGRQGSQVLGRKDLQDPLDLLAHQDLLGQLGPMGYPETLGDLALMG